MYFFLNFGFAIKKYIFYLKLKTRLLQSSSYKFGWLFVNFLILDHPRVYTYIHIMSVYATEVGKCLLICFLHGLRGRPTVGTSKEIVSAVSSCTTYIIFICIWYSRRYIIDKSYKKYAHSYSTLYIYTYIYMCVCVCYVFGRYWRAGIKIAS